MNRISNTELGILVQSSLMLPDVNACSSERMRDVDKICHILFKLCSHSRLSIVAHDLFLSIHFIYGYFFSNSNPWNYTSSKFHFGCNYKLPKYPKYFSIEFFKWNEMKWSEAPSQRVRNVFDFWSIYFEECYVLTNMHCQFVYME